MTAAPDRAREAGRSGSHWFADVDEKRPVNGQFRYIYNATGGTVDVYASLWDEEYLSEQILVRQRLVDASVRDAVIAELRVQGYTVTEPGQ